MSATLYAEYTYEAIDQSLPVGFYDKQAVLYLMDAATERFVLQPEGMGERDAGHCEPGGLLPGQQRGGRSDAGAGGGRHRRPQDVGHVLAPGEGARLAVLPVAGQRRDRVLGGLRARLGHPAGGAGGQRGPGARHRHLRRGLRALPGHLRLPPPAPARDPARPRRRARPAQRAADARPAGGPGGQRVEVGLPRQHEPRHPHAHERRARLHHHYLQGGRRSREGARLRRARSWPRVAICSI